MATNPFPLSKEQLLEAYRMMRTIREFEERVHAEFATGDIPGFVHLYAGEEAIAAGVCAPDDRDRSPPRTAATATASPRAATGRHDGRDLRQGDRHLQGQGRLDAHRRPVQGHARRQRHRRRRRAARLRRGLTAKYRKDGGVGVSFFGDGGSNQGTFLESLNLAAVWNLPASSSSRTTATPSRPRAIRHRRRRSSTAPTASACPASPSTASTSSPSMRPPARPSSAPAQAAARRCSNARSSASTATSRATSRPTAPRRGREPARQQGLPQALAARVTEAGVVKQADLDEIDAEVGKLIERAVVEAKAAPLPTAEGPDDRRLRFLLRGDRRARSGQGRRYPHTLSSIDPSGPAPRWSSAGRPPYSSAFEGTAANGT